MLLRVGTERERESSRLISQVRELCSGGAASEILNSVPINE